MRREPAAGRPQDENAEVRHAPEALADVDRADAAPSGCRPCSVGERHGSVQSFYRAWFGSAEQSPEAYASFYAPDGFVLPPDGVPVRGRLDIADWLRRARAQTAFTLRPEGISVDEIRFLGDGWVLYRSTLSGSRKRAATRFPSPPSTWTSSGVETMGIGR